MARACGTWVMRRPPLHLEQPCWENGFDLSADAAVATRRRLVECAASEGMRVMAFHSPVPSVGHISATSQGGWEWMPTV